MHPLLQGHNRTKATLLDGGVALGMFLLSGSSMLAEVCSTLPLDWLMVDLEASPISRYELLPILQSLNGSTVTPFVRAQSREHWHLEQILDLGVQGILVPKVDDADTARRVVAACRFPPLGARGVNPVRASGYFSDVAGYLSSANERVLCMVQIESAKAVAAAAEIAAVEGIDGLFIGAGDLALSLGQPANVVGPKMDDACHRVLEAAQRAGKFPGIFAYSLELADIYAEQGFKFIAIGNDVKAIREWVTGSASHVRGRAPASIAAAISGSHPPSRG
jgi:2-keto-3-deoxy-L-rhamnonate aldolase RhmA